VTRCSRSCFCARGRMGRPALALPEAPRWAAALAYREFRAPRPKEHKPSTLFSGG